MFSEKVGPTTVVAFENNQITNHSLLVVTTFCDFKASSVPLPMR